MCFPLFRFFLTRTPPTNSTSQCRFQWERSPPERDQQGTTDSLANEESASRLGVFFVFLNRDESYWSFNQFAKLTKGTQSHWWPQSKREWLLFSQKQLSIRQNQSSSQRSSTQVTPPVNEGDSQPRASSGPLILRNRKIWDIDSETSSRSSWKKRREKDWHKPSCQPSPKE